MKVERKSMLFISKVSEFYLFEIKINFVVKIKPAQAVCDIDYLFVCILGFSS